MIKPINITLAELAHVRERLCGNHTHFACFTCTAIADKILYFMAQFSVVVEAPPITHTEKCPKCGQFMLANHVCKKEVIHV